MKLQSTNYSLNERVILKDKSCVIGFDQELSQFAVKITYRATVSYLIVCHVVKANSHKKDRPLPTKGLRARRDPWQSSGYGTSPPFSPSFSAMLKRWSNKLGGRHDASH